MLEKNQKQKLTTFAFIDSQNLNLGTSKNIYNNKKLVYKGWKLDFKKFRRYLTDKFRVTQAFLFIGHIKENEKLYQALKMYGYKLVFKPTVMDETGLAKGNVDAELVLYSAAIEFRRFDKAVVVSGDGDFYCLYEFLEKNNKLLNVIIPNTKSQSSLLTKFQRYKVFIDFERSKLELKRDLQKNDKKSGRRRS